MSGISVEVAADIRMAGEIDKYAGETARIEVHRDPVLMRSLFHGGAVGQQVDAGKAENLEPRLELLRRRRRRRRAAESQEHSRERP
jgi:hypothetical protein